MPDKKLFKPRQDILFVCYGNFCRSPMAEGLAKKILGDRIHIESAGLDPIGYRAAPEAEKVMKESFDVDISTHKPKNVANLPVERFDWIIALDAAVYHALKQFFSSASAKIILWDIEDPLGKDEKMFLESAGKIKKYIQENIS